MHSVRLVDKHGKVFRVGDSVIDFRGNTDVLKRVLPPKHPASSGKVVTSTGMYYPSVYNLKFVDAMHSNYSILVNWSDTDFGCSRRCSYCNWKTHTLLPHGAPNSERIETFIGDAIINNCKFITVSGGGDPLFDVPTNWTNIQKLALQIKSAGVLSRIITREVKEISAVIGLYDHVSISLDNESARDTVKYRHLWAGIQVECSLVMPPLPTSELVGWIPEWLSLQKKLGLKLILREDINSVWDVDLEALFECANGELIFLSKKVCLNGQYLLNDVQCHGSQLMLSGEVVIDQLLKANARIIGGAMQHLIAPSKFATYHDIDAVFQDVQNDPLYNIFFNRWLSNNYIVSELMMPTDSRVHYRLCKSKKGGHNLHLIYTADDKSADLFIGNAQYDIDRLYIDAHGIHAVNTENKQLVLQKLKSREATRLEQSDKSLFSGMRPLIERLHAFKLTKKGFKIYDIH